MVETWRLEEHVVAYDSEKIPTSWGVELIVAGARVSLSTKQPNALRPASHSKAKKGSGHFVY